MNSNINADNFLEWLDPPELVREAYRVGCFAPIHPALARRERFQPHCQPACTGAELRDRPPVAGHSPTAGRSTP